MGRTRGKQKQQMGATEISKSGKRNAGISWGPWQRRCPQITVPWCTQEGVCLHGLTVSRLFASSGTCVRHELESPYFNNPEALPQKLWEGGRSRGHQQPGPRGFCSSSVLLRFAGSFAQVHMLSSRYLLTIHYFR